MANGLLSKTANPNNVIDRLALVENLLRDLQAIVSRNALDITPTADGLIIDISGFLLINQMRIKDYIQLDDQHVFGFLKPDLSGYLFTISTDASSELAFNDQGSKNGYIFITTLTGSGTAQLVWREDPANANVAQMDLGLGAQGTKLTFGGEIAIKAKGASGGSNRIGIGTDDPQRAAHIIGSDGAVTTFPSSLATNDHLVLENNGNLNIAMISSTGGVSQIRFYEDGQAAGQAFFQYHHGTNNFILDTSGTTRVTVGPGVQVGAPTGGDKGAGTLNAVAVYDDNVLLTDYLFDLFYDGKMRPEDAKRHPEARIWSIPETAAFTEKNRHLPTMPGRDEWEASGSKSVGELVTALWATVEQQQLQIFDLQKQIDELKAVN